MSDKNLANLPKIVHLEAEKVHELLIECFAKANLLEAGQQPVKNFATKLVVKLKEDEEIVKFLCVLGRTDYQNYLRDLYTRALKMMKQGNAKLPCGFSPEHVMPLLMYLEKPDAITKLLLAESSPAVGNYSTEKKARDVYILQAQVLYSKKSYSRWSVLRNPDNGVIHLYENGDFIFDGEEHLYIKFGALKNIELRRMYRDPFPWIKLTYEKDSRSYIVYLAKVENVGGNLKMADPQVIFHTLRHRLIPS